jgi:iduronate 2-sulfatase
MTITKRLLSLVCVATIGMAQSQLIWGAATATKPNFSFISIDDLCPELGCYGVKVIKTPHLDRLAADGSVFLKSYCNAAVCGASRASFMTGMRPIPGKRFKSWNSRADKGATHIATLPDYFRQHEYYTISNGKVMHLQGDSPQAWSEPKWRSNGNHGAAYHH